MERRRAMIRDGEILMLAEDKIARFGGVEQVMRNLKGKGLDYVILQACRDGAMTPGEIGEFNKLIGRDDPGGVRVLVTMRGKLFNPAEPQHGKITRVSGITTIYESENNLWWISHGHVGYLTTDIGIDQLSTSRGSQQGIAGVLKPRTI